VCQRRRGDVAREVRPLCGPVTANRPTHAPSDLPGQVA
jgi:hypothetical protein